MQRGNLEVKDHRTERSTTHRETGHVDVCIIAPRILPAFNLCANAGGMTNLVLYNPPGS